MRLFKRHRDDESAETPCPRCGVPVPAESVECAVCGWDSREAYVGPDPTSSGSASGAADEE